MEDFISSSQASRVLNLVAETNSLNSDLNLNTNCSLNWHKQYKLTKKDLAPNFKVIKLFCRFGLLPFDFDPTWAKITKKGQNGAKFNMGVGINLIWNIFVSTRAFLMLCTAIYVNYSAPDFKKQYSRLLLIDLLILCIVLLYPQHLTAIFLHQDAHIKLINGMLSYLNENQSQSQNQNQGQGKNDNHSENQDGGEITSTCQKLKHFLRRSYQEQILLGLPCLIFGMVVAVPFLAVVDPSLPLLLSSFAAPSSFRGWGEWISTATTVKVMTFILFILIDSIFLAILVGWIYYEDFCLFFFTIRVNEEAGRAMENVKNKGQGQSRGQNGNRAAVQSLKFIKMLVALYNIDFSTANYLLKILCLIASVLGGFGAIKLMHTNPPYAAIYAMIFIEAAFLYNAIFDNAYTITEKTKLLKTQIALSLWNVENEKVENRGQNFENPINPVEVKDLLDEEFERLEIPRASKEREGKLVREKEIERAAAVEKVAMAKDLQAVRKLGIQLGTFYVIEREATLVFMGFVVEQIVGLLLTFN